MTPFERDIFRRLNYLYKQIQCLKQRVCCGQDCCNGCGCNSNDNYCNNDIRVGDSDNQLFSTNTIITPDAFLEFNNLGNEQSALTLNRDEIATFICEVASRQCELGGDVNNVTNITNRIGGNNLLFRWGWSDINPAKTHSTAIGTVYQDNLYMEIPFWNYIQDMSPVLLIDRYNPKKASKDRNGNIVSVRYKFTHEPINIAFSNSRASEVTITNRFTTLEFGQINYFGFNSGYPKGKGMRGYFTNKGWWVRHGIGASVYLGFRLRLNDNGSVIETGHLGFLRMQIIRRNALIRLTYKTQ